MSADSPWIWSEEHRDYYKRNRKPDGSWEFTWGRATIPAEPPANTEGETAPEESAPAPETSVPPTTHSSAYPGSTRPSQPPTNNPQGYYQTATTTPALHYQQPLGGATPTPHHTPHLPYQSTSSHTAPRPNPQPPHAFTPQRTSINYTGSSPGSQPSPGYAESSGSASSWVTEGYPRYNYPPGQNPGNYGGNQ